jgi:hypothetical protein
MHIINLFDSFILDERSSLLTVTCTLKDQPPIAQVSETSFPLYNVLSVTFARGPVLQSVDSDIDGDWVLDLQLTGGHTLRFVDRGDHASLTNMTACHKVIKQYMRNVSTEPF